MINDIFYVLTNWLIDVVINQKKKFPGLISRDIFTVS